MLTERLGDGKINCLELAAREASPERHELVFLDDSANRDGNNAGHVLIRDKQSGRVWDPNSEQLSPPDNPQQWQHADVDAWIDAQPKQLAHGSDAPYSERGAVDASDVNDLLGVSPAARRATIRASGDAELEQVAELQVADAAGSPLIAQAKATTADIRPYANDFPNLNESAAPAQGLAEIKAYMQGAFEDIVDQNASLDQLAAVLKQRGGSNTPLTRQEIQAVQEMAGVYRNNIELLSKNVMSAGLTYTRQIGAAVGAENDAKQEAKVKKIMKVVGLVASGVSLVAGNAGAAVSATGSVADVIGGVGRTADLAAFGSLQYNSHLTFAEDGSSDSLSAITSDIGLDMSQDAVDSTGALQRVVDRLAWHENRTTGMPKLSEELKDQSRVFLGATGRTLTEVDAVGTLVEMHKDSGVGKRTYSDSDSRWTEEYVTDKFRDYVSKLEGLGYKVSYDEDDPVDSFKIYNDTRWAGNPERDGYVWWGPDAGLSLWTGGRNVGFNERLDRVDDGHPVHRGTDDRLSTEQMAGGLLFTVQRHAGKESWPAGTNEAIASAVPAISRALQASP